MIATYTQIVAGVIVLFACAYEYIQAMEMSAVNRRRHLNGSSGVTARTIKRRAVIQGLKGLTIIYSGVYIIRWVNARPIVLPAADQIIAIRSFSFTIICFLIVLNIVWDVFNRRDAYDLKQREDELRGIQKRASDPKVGDKLVQPVVIETATQNIDTSTLKKIEVNTKVTAVAAEKTDAAVQDLKNIVITHKENS